MKKTITLLFCIIPLCVAAQAPLDSDQLDGQINLVRDKRVVAAVKRLDTAALEKNAERIQQRIAGAKKYNKNLYVNDIMPQIVEIFRELDSSGFTASVIYNKTNPIRNFDFTQSKKFALIETEASQRYRKKDLAEFNELMRLIEKNKPNVLAHLEKQEKAAEPSLEKLLPPANSKMIEDIAIWESAEGSEGGISGGGSGSGGACGLLIAGAAGLTKKDAELAKRWDKNSEEERAASVLSIGISAVAVLGCFFL